MYKYLKRISNTDNISEWKSKKLSDEVIKPPDNSLAPTLGYDQAVIGLKTVLKLLNLKQKFLKLFQMYCV